MTNSCPLCNSEVSFAVQEDVSNFLAWSKTGVLRNIPVDVCFDENVKGMMYEDGAFIKMGTDGNGHDEWVVPTPMNTDRFYDLFDAEKFLWEQWSQHNYI